MRIINFSFEHVHHGMEMDECGDWLCGTISLWSWGKSKVNEMMTDKINSIDIQYKA